MSFTVGSPGPAAGRQIIGSYVTGLLSSYAAGLRIVCPYVTGHGLWAGRPNSGSAGDGPRAGRLNSSVFCPDCLVTFVIGSPCCSVFVFKPICFRCSPLVPYVMLCYVYVRSRVLATLSVSCHG
ncbi:hypothetical protein ATANTOWER_003823 [Ataeniobius toweri]|uniref:Brain protein I3 n=1 Tax=Ataeniobius toweri TaxID=208326 RepID=A0ABU7BNE0_9TELE|nr:hypothetical protein [Ataeniobius toweri]